VKESTPLKISSLSRKVKPKMNSANIGAVVTQTSHIRPSFCLASIHRVTGGSRRTSRNRLHAEYW
jgi:hypothetical protein